MKVEFTLTAGEEIKALFGRFPRVVNEEMLRALVDVTEFALKKVTESTPTASGDTRKSLSSWVQPIEGGQLGVEQIAGGLLGVVASAQPHVKYVELGTRPHTFGENSPKAGEGALRPALEIWAMEKFKISEKEAKRVAYLVARKIRRDGTKGVHMFSKTAERLHPYMEKAFAKARDRIVERTKSGA